MTIVTAQTDGCRQYVGRFKNATRAEVVAMQHLISHHERKDARNIVVTVDGKRVALLVNADRRGKIGGLPLYQMVEA